MRFIVVGWIATNASHLLGPGNQLLQAGNLKVSARLDVSGNPDILNHMVQYSTDLDRSFAALSDPTRRAILLRLGRSDASISDLAQGFEMTLTGLKKHVRVLEDAGLVKTEKIGRVRRCALGPRRLEDVTKWIASYRSMLEQRLDHLEAFLERTKNTR